MSRLKILSPASVTFFFGLILIVGVIIQGGGDPLALAQIGTRFSIGDPEGTEGYDGQFAYYIAANPSPKDVTDHLDVPAYRYQRILLPMLAALFSFGRVEIIAWLFPIISLAAHSAAVHKLASLISDWGHNQWYALSYGLWVGLLLALRLDLPEALALALVVFAICWSMEGKLPLSALAYGLAVFAKETMLLFVFGHAFYFLISKRWRELTGLLLATLLPFAVFQIYLLRNFGEFGIASGGFSATPFEWIPFNGIWRIADFDLQLMLIFALIYFPIIIFPSLWGIWAAIRKMLRKEKGLLASILLANAIIFPFLPFSLYREPIGLLRLMSSLVLALVLFSTRYDYKAILKFTVLGITLNAIILSELLIR